MNDPARDDPDEGLVPEDGPRLIQAPKPLEVNPSVYKDVEPLLFRGFLSVAARINDVPFVFKSLNHHEFALIQAMAGDAGDGGVGGLYDMFLAFGVFMIDGQNILPERDRWVREVAASFAEYPDMVKARIVRQLAEINRRASNAILLTEAYSMETYSRYRWAQLRDMDVTSTAVTGVPGTAILGMNWAQLAWRAINHYEDQRENVEREWENAKFVGSCFAGKGISKVYAQDNGRRQREAEDRSTRKDRLLRQVILGEAAEGQKDIKAGTVIVVAKTVEELADQLERDLKGEKDWHDQVVEAQERRIRQQYENRASVLQPEEGEPGTWGTVDMTGLSLEQVEQALAEQRARRAAAPRRSQAQTQISPAFYQKWLGDEPPPQRGPAREPGRPAREVPLVPVRRK